MSRADAWSGNTWPLAPWLDDHDQAVDEALIISDKTTSIVVKRGTASAMAAQTVRIEGLSGSRQAVSDTGDVFTIDAVVFGYAGHPTIANTDLKPGDRFDVASVFYEVVMLIPGLPDSLQAYCKVVG